MKVGILTLYYNNYNYGGLLQAYALVYALKSLGVDAEQIQFDYQYAANKTIKNDSGIRKIANQIIGRSLSVRAYNMLKFQNYIAHSALVYNVSDIDKANAVYDAFICGGDQIWNDWKRLDERVIDVFSLGFADNSKICASYAASTGGTDLSSNHMKKLINNISNLKCISVREKSAAEFLGKCINRYIEVVADPVMLLTADNWRKVAKKSDTTVPRKKYAVCYFLGNSVENKRTANECAHILGLKTVVFPHIDGSGFSRKYNDFGDIKDRTSGPLEFVKLLSEAEYIFTDSYHAIVFAFIFHKPFYVFNRQKVDYKALNMNSRITDFLQYFEMQDRLIINAIPSHEDMQESISFEKADIVLKELKNKSLKYLKEALNIDLIINKAGIENEN